MTSSPSGTTAPSLPSPKPGSYPPSGPYDVEGVQESGDEIFHVECANSLALVMGYEESREQLPSCAPLRYLRKLEIWDLDDWLESTDAEAVAACPYLTQLRSLVFWEQLGDDIEAGLGVGVEGAAAVVSSPHLCELQDLGLGGQGIGAEEVKRLVAAIRLPRLTRLDLHSNTLKERGAQALASSPHLQTLKILNLSFNQMGDSGVASLAGSFLQLKELFLHGNDISKDGIIALGTSLRLSQLEALHLDWNPLGNEGVETLARSPFVSSLKALYLRGCEMTDEGVQALVSSPYLSRLKLLDLRDNKLTAEGLKMLAGRVSRGWVARTDELEGRD